MDNNIQIAGVKNSAIADLPAHHKYGLSDNSPIKGNKLDDVKVELREEHKMP